MFVVPRLAVALSLLAPLTVAQTDEDPLVPLELTIDTSSLGDFAHTNLSMTKQARVRWEGTIGKSEVEMLLFVFPADFELEGPYEVVDLIERNRARESGKGNLPAFAFDETRPLAGVFGHTSFAWLGHEVETLETKPIGDFYCLGALLRDEAYALQVTCRPALSKESREAVEKFFVEGVRYTGEVRDHRWTDEEVQARWQSDAPAKVLEKSKLMVVRTDHYLILTNQGKGTAKSFGEKIDEAYEKIRSVYPFEEVEGERLLPIFYFTTPDQYYEWGVKNCNWTREEAERSAGVSFGDVYSTYHQATNAPVHIHEATHQIFKNRLRLGGGGSWFQEGVAEYMSSTANDLGGFKGIAKRKKHVPLREFVTIPSLLQSSAEDRKSGGSEAGDNYEQAAALIEFVRHSKLGKEKFPQFVHTMGKLPRGDEQKIEGALQALFSLDLDEFDAEFAAYWTKRKRPRSK